MGKPMMDHRRHNKAEKTEPPQRDNADVVQEGNAPSSASVPAPEKTEPLKEKLEALEKERDEVFSRLQRLSADYANYQKRVPKQIADTVAYERERLIRTLLPICDNFELTIKKAGTGENAEMVLAGIRIIYDQMLDVLKAQEVEPIKAENEEFDPTRHEALMLRCDPDKEDSIILEECQRGYTLSGRVLRPSKVVVNRAPRSQPAPDQGAGQSLEETPDAE